MTATLELRAGAARMSIAPQIGGAIAAHEWNGEPILRPTPEDALVAGDVRRFSAYPLLPYPIASPTRTVRLGFQHTSSHRRDDARPLLCRLAAAGHNRLAERGLAAAISADAACEYLVGFVPPDRDFCAVEPVTHMTDAFNRAEAGAPNTGTRVLAPGATFSCTMRISVSPGADDAVAV